jgi:hypothetical protein
MLKDFPTKSFLIQLLTATVALANKIPSGFYLAETGSDNQIEVDGNKYRYADIRGSSWRSSSELSFVKKGVIQLRSDRKSYYCLVNNLPQNRKHFYICTRNGWKKQSF